MKPLQPSLPRLILNGGTAFALIITLFIMDQVMTMLPVSTVSSFVLTLVAISGVFIGYVNSETASVVNVMKDTRNVDRHFVADQNLATEANLSHKRSLLGATSSATRQHDVRETVFPGAHVHNVTKALSITIDVDNVVAPLDHFWESTGFCPPDPHSEACRWFLSTDVWHNLVYIGSVPHQGILNVRVHYLLDAVFVLRLQNGHPVYNFTCLDTFIERLHGNNLKPGFELMGNPSGFFTDFENHTQVLLWRDLVHQIASRYIDKYGLEYLMQWNFESWNEPKARSFDGLNFTYQGFFNYYDACSEGLRLASDKLILGAPSGGCKENYSLDNFSWRLLSHIDHGRNYFTGQNYSRVDYISIHKKGSMPNNTAVIMSKENNFEDLLAEHLPRLITVPLVNDEADPLVTWSRPLTWRADVTYAGMIAKVVHQHQKAYHATRDSVSVKFKLLSNDNGFLSYQPHPFSQRTLLARFQINSTVPPSVHFVRKPSHSVMGLLSLLGDQQVLVSLEGDESSIDVLASRSDGAKRDAKPQSSSEVAALVYYSTDTRNDTFSESSSVVLCNLTFKNINQMKGTDTKFVVYMLDSDHGNPWKTWQTAKSPKSPSPEVFEDMRSNQDPVRVAGPSDVQLTSSGDFTTQITLMLPSVALVHVCAKPPSPPAKVSSVALYGITSNQVLVSWSDKDISTRCLQRYNVEYSNSTSQKSFVTVNVIDSIVTAFVFAPSKGSVHGYYRVQAVDYWQRRGPYSSVVKY